MQSAFVVRDSCGKELNERDAWSIVYLKGILPLIKAAGIKAEQ